jgi:hypothetical protein
MDARIQSIKDPDGRMVSKKKVGDKEIKKVASKFETNEMGYLQFLISNKMVQLLLQKWNYSGYFGSYFTQFKTTFTLDFDGQVPIQIRRSGRNNAEG